MPISAKDFLGTTEIEVPLTYPALVKGNPIEIVLFCKLALSADDEAARQAFYSQSAGDMAAGQHAYNVDMLSRIMTRPPQGFPGFEEYVKDQIVAEYNARPHEAGKDERPEIDRDSISLGNLNDGKLIEHFKTYLSDPTQMAVKIASDAIGRYNRITQPDELFR